MVNISHGSNVNWYLGRCSGGGEHLLGLPRADDQQVDARDHGRRGVAAGEQEGNVVV